MKEQGWQEFTAHSSDLLFDFYFLSYPILSTDEEDEEDEDEDEDGEAGAEEAEGAQTVSGSSAVTATSVHPSPPQQINSSPSAAKSAVST